MAKQKDHPDVVKKMEIVKNNILSILLLLLLTGCCSFKTPVNCYEYQKQRAEERIYILTKKFPELIQPTDTIRLSDTINTHGVAVDTTFVFGVSNDTLIIERDKLIVKYLKTDSIIYLMGECLSDTIFIEREIIVENIIVKEPTKNNNKQYFLFGFFGVIAVLLLYFINRIFKFWE